MRSGGPWAAGESSHVRQVGEGPPLPPSPGMFRGVMMMSCSLRKASTSPPPLAWQVQGAEGVMMMPCSLRKASTMMSVSALRQQDASGARRLNRISSQDNQIQLTAPGPGRTCMLTASPKYAQPPSPPHP